MKREDEIFSDRTITVSISRSVTDGNYGSIKAHVGYSGKIEDDVNAEDAYQLAYKVAEKELDKWLADHGIV